MSDFHLNLFTEPEAADQLGVDPRTLRRWRKIGKVSYLRTPGGRVRYRFDDLAALKLGMLVQAVSPPAS